MSRMLKSSGAMGAATLTSRVLGLVREQVYARFMGTDPVAGAFQMAFIVPNLFRRLLGEGALTAAFIPIFKEKEAKGSLDEMWAAANAVISGLLVMAGAVIGALALGLTVILWVWPMSSNTRLMFELLRLMSPYALLVCLAAVLMGMLNARGWFFLPAFGSVLLNLILIASALWLAPRLGHTLDVQVFGLAIGVLVAGTVQAAFQLPVLRRQGYRYRWVSPWGNPTVREVVRKMLPASVGVAAFQLNVLVTQGLAFGVYAPIVAAFNYAVRLMEFPQGLFGTSLATYLLPALSGLAATKQHAEFRATLRQGLTYLFYANLLAAALLTALAEPIIRLLFEYGRFDRVSTLEVSRALACLGPGLLAYSAVNLEARAFFALGDTSTPMRISVFTLVLNVVLSALLLPRFHAMGLALANSLTSCLNAGLLTYALRRKLGRLELSPLRRQAWILTAAAALAGAVAWTIAHFWRQHFGYTTIPLRVGEVFLPITAAATLYFLITLRAGIPTARELIALIRSGPPDPPPGGPAQDQPFPADNP